MNNKYESHQMNDDEIMYSKTIRAKAAYLDEMLEEALPNSRERSLAMTKLEECVMWANKAIALHGMK